MKTQPRQAFFPIFTLAVFALLSAGRAEGAEETLPDTFGLRLGGYNIRSATTILRRDSANYPVGGYVDFADTLGGETEARVLRLDGFYRFDPHHALGYSWYDLKFTGSRVLGQDIQWGDTVYPLNTQVDSELRFSVYKVNYQYSLHNDKNVELGVLAGFHVMKVGIDLNAVGISRSTSETITAPLPVFGLFARYNFTPRFSAYYNYQWFFISIDDKVRGGLQDFILGAEYRVIENLALGLAYNRFALDIKAKRDASTTYVETDWNGGMLYGAVYF
jgi:hypothetical protein